MNMIVKVIFSILVFLIIIYIVSLRREFTLTKSYAPSYVLMAMGIAEEEIESSIRISWGPDTDKEETLCSFKELLCIAKQMK